MRRIIALVALATALISTPAFPAWEIQYSTDNLTRLTQPKFIFVIGRLTHDGSPEESHSGSSLAYNCEIHSFGITGKTTHQGIFEFNTWPEIDTLRGIFDGPNRPVNKVEHFPFTGRVTEEETYLSWLMTVSASASLPATSFGFGLFEKIKTGEVTSIRIEFPTESGGLVFEYDTDNFPADACEG